MENNDNTQNNGDADEEEVLDNKAYMDAQIPQIKGADHIYLFGIDNKTDGRKASPEELVEHWNQCGAGKRFREENLKKFLRKIIKK